MADAIPPPVAAAGVMFVTADGRVLFCRRVDDGHYWAFPGGGIQAGETAEVAARREAQEETGISAGELTPLTRRIKDSVDFTTFLCRVPDSFTPVLNEEHDLYQWMTPEEVLETGGLHPGAYIALLRGGMDEHDIARAMAIDELVSPQRYQNLLLIDLRITGTGASYRSHAGPKDEDGKHRGEYVWRDPSLYLNGGFMERCQGLPVVIDHPDTDVLDTDEFKDRVVGAIMLPHIRDDAVWGVARIYDQAAATMLETKRLSTSPGVLIGGKRVPAGDGKDIFVEGKPSLLDHLAICVLGVWDKGGPAAGVLNQLPIGDTTMPDQTPEEKILDSLNKLHARMDKYESRMDAMEACEKDRARKDAEAEEKAKKDAAEAEEKAKKDAEAKAADDKAKKDAEAKEAEEKAKKDAEAAAAKDAADLKTRLAGIEGKLKEPTPEERTKFTAAQVRADRVFQAFGDSAGAPRFQAGESLLDYRKRLVNAHKAHSQAWKDVDLTAITDEAMFGNIENQVFADALIAARNPIHDNTGPTLREVLETDDTGRRIRTFVGSPEACWGPFKQEVRKVTRISKPETH